MYVKPISTRFSLGKSTPAIRAIRRCTSIKIKNSFASQGRFSPSLSILRQQSHAAPVPRPEMLCIFLLPACIHNLKSKDVWPDFSMTDPMTDKRNAFALHYYEQQNPLSPSRFAAAAHNFPDWQNQPCLCLCFGFSQIIRTLPFLLITLHFSHIGFTDDLTFTKNPPFPQALFVTESPQCLQNPKNIRVVL